MVKDKKVNKKIEQHLKQINLLKKQSKVRKIKSFLKGGDLLLIMMELRNGDHDCFTIQTATDNFQYKKASYIIDTGLKYFNIPAKMYALDYHQDIALPVKRSIPVGTIKSVLESKQLDVNTEYAINPDTLERFIYSKVAEGTMAGQGLQDWFKKAMGCLVVSTCAVVTHMVIYMVKSGMFNEIGATVGLK